MAQSIKNMKILLQQWLKKSREAKRSQCILAAKLKANIANIECRSSIEEMNSIQSYAGFLIKITYKNFTKFILEDIISDIAANLNEAIECCINDLDNLSPKKKTSMKSLKPRKRKAEKPASKSAKISKTVKPDAFLDNEAIESKHTLSLYKNNFQI